MDSSIWKLKALLRKNFYELKRNIFSTLIEIFFPIIVILLFYSLKVVYDIENIEFDLQEGSLKNFTKMRSVFNSDIYPKLNSSPYAKYIKENINNIDDIDINVIRNISFSTPEI